MQGTSHCDIWGGGGGGAAAPDGVEDAEVDIVAQHLVHLAEDPVQCHVTHASAWGGCHLWLMSKMMSMCLGSSACM